MPGVKQLFTSAGAARRLARAREWLVSRRRDQRVLIIGASPEAAAEMARQAALKAKASFGWQRMTLGRLAAVAAARALAERQLSPLSSVGLEAVCARVVHRLRGSLGKFEPVATQPGLPRALLRTLLEMRMADARPSGDLGRILEAYEEELARAGLADRALVFRLAASAEKLPLFDLPALLIDLPLDSALEEALVARLLGDVAATAAAGDERAIARLSRALGVAPDQAPETSDTSLARVQQRLFVEGLSELPPLGEDVLVLSAPGESRECIEIARLVRREASRGVPFDRMAVLLRSPSQYRALLEEAFARARIPAHFATGTLRPDPAGRAFLALLACAAEGLSARRFAEYLSLGEVPDAVGGQPPPAPSPADRWVPPDAELLARPVEEPEPEREPPEAADPDAPVVAGNLRAPARWERLLMDAAVIGGRQRWERRLKGLEARLRAELEAHSEDEARSQRILRDLSDLRALRDFALPLLDSLSALPEQAAWGEWIDPLTALATRALREPARVLSLLAELAPMAPVGPVALSEVRLVLSRRLTDLSRQPSDRRAGKVFVAQAAAARGLSFDVVFVPGLAEKVFPQKVIEDPLLRDSERRALGGMETSQDRVAAERLFLRLAVGAAAQKVVLCWPRIDLSQGRARVPSFYGLEVLRAGEGKLPAFADLARRAEQASQSRAGWPAPRDPQDAIDDAEHDLSLLARSFRLPESESRGTAAYLLHANPHLGRALRARARRWLKRWTPADGLVQPSPDGLAALQAHQLSARSYSPTALQNFAACPYKFVLQALHRITPREVPEAIDEIDPIERGSLIHKIQYTFLRAEPLPIADLAAAQDRLERVIEELALQAKDELNPAVERIWDDCIAGVKIDLREWLRRLSEDREWTPWRFELAFGLAETGERDEHSTKEPVRLDQGLQLRGSIDLVERKGDGSLRATDYKTGKAWAKDGVVIGGGATLQPALYALALEKLFPGAGVEGGRLYYCTHVGEFSSVPVPLGEGVRSSVKALAHTVADALQQGFLPAAPRDERECSRCDYLPICGPSEWPRSKRKPREPLLPLLALRDMP